jgi:RNA polymerase sigma factor (sigma-70 family)
MAEKSKINIGLDVDLNSQQQLYDQYSGQMYSVCLRYCRNEHTACDALHDGFIKVFNHIDKYNAKGDLGAWIRRIMVNTCIDIVKASNKIKFSELEVNNADQPVEFQESMTYDALLLLLDQLPLGNRMVFTMHVIDGIEHVEIAQALNITETTSRTHLFKARKKLQDIINKNSKLYI